MCVLTRKDVCNIRWELRINLNDVSVIHFSNVMEALCCLPAKNINNCCLGVSRKSGREGAPFKNLGNCWY